MGLLVFGKEGTRDGISNLQREFLAGKQAEAVAGDIPGRQCKQQADEEDEAEVGAVELACRHRAWVRRQVDVHNRKCTSGRQSKGKDGAV